MNKAKISVVCLQDFYKLKIVLIPIVKRKEKKKAHIEGQKYVICISTPTLSSKISSALYQKKKKKEEKRSKKADLKEA